MPLASAGFRLSAVRALAKIYSLELEPQAGKGHTHFARRFFGEQPLRRK
jgi:hypothetical protein